MKKTTYLHRRFENVKIDQQIMEHKIKKIFVLQVKQKKYTRFLYKFYQTKL